MPSLQDLGLKNETLEGTDVPLESLPEFGGAAPPPPAPGAYRFRLPDASKLATNFDLVASEKYGQRVQVQFDQDSPLIIVQSPGGTMNNEPYQTRFSNVPRLRGRKGEQVLASDWDLLLRALGQAYPDVKAERPKTNAAYIKALQAYAGKEFGADVEWSWSCNPKRTVWIPDDQGGSIEHPEGVQGCGKRYYQNNIDKVEGQYPLRITCVGTRIDAATGESVTCGAIIRAFANLTNFRK